MVRRTVEPLQRHQRLILKPVPSPERAGRQASQSPFDKIGHFNLPLSFVRHSKDFAAFHLRVLRGFPAGISQLDFASDAETRFIISFSSPSLPVHPSPTYT